MSLVSVPFVPKDGSLVITDGAGTPLSFTVPYEVGGISWSEISHNQKEIEHFFSRGRWIGMRETQDRIMEFSFDCYAVGFTSATDANILDVVRRAGLWVAATPTLPMAQGGCNADGTSGVMTVQCKWIGERSNLGGTADSSIAMKYCYLTGGFQEGVGGKFNIKGIAVPFSTDHTTWA